MDNGFFPQNLNADCQISDSFSEAYRACVMNLPYNSAFAFEKLFGLAPIPKGNFGDNCMSQAVIIKKLFADRFDRSGYLADGRHRAVLFVNRSSRSIIFLDPYVLHQFPICINNLLLKPGSSLKFPVFPEVASNFMQLTYDQNSNCLIQEKIMSHGKVCFRYNFTDISFTDPNPYQEDLLYSSEQDNLSIRTVSRDGQSMLHCVCRLQNVINQYKQGLTPWIPWFARRNGAYYSSDDTGFYECLSEIAFVVKQSPTNIIKFMNNAIFSYLRRMPNQLYSMEGSSTNLSNM